jgi:hypothetical protein
VVNSERVIHQNPHKRHIHSHSFSLGRLPTFVSSG